MQKENIWKCECGKIEYGKYPPEECRGCLRINEFVELTEQEIEEMEKNGNNILEELE